MMRVLLLSAALLGLLAAPAAADVTLRGKLAPAAAKSAQRLGAVRAVRLETGEVAAATRARGRWSLRVPPGRYAVLAQAADTPGRSFRARPRLVRAGKRAVRVKTMLRRVRAATAAAGYVLGVQPIRIAGVKGYPSGLPVSGVLTTELVGRDCGTNGESIDLVEIEHRDEIFREIRRTNDPAFEGKGLDEANVIAPKQFVQGEGSVAGGTVTLTVRIVTAGTGAEIAQAQVSGRLRDLVDLVGTLSDELVRDLCDPQVDVVFEGAATYRRTEGSSATDAQHDVTAAFHWTTAYRAVDLGAAAGIQTAEVSAEGTWEDVGRDGAPGPGGFTCGGALASRAPLALGRLDRTPTGLRLVAAPFLGLGPAEDTSCSGLPGAPYSPFDITGDEALTAAIDLDAARIAAGPVQVAVAPTAALPADCSGTPRYDAPCHQVLSWSGTVTLTRVSG